MLGTIIDQTTGEEREETLEEYNMHLRCVCGGNCWLARHLSQICTYVNITEDDFSDWIDRGVDFDVEQADLLESILDDMLGDTW